MTQAHTIHRLHDGSIDIDFYRTRAVALRAQAVQDAFKLKAAFRFTLISLATIVCVTIAASVPAYRA